ncbi:hypothetical protein MY7_2114 [Bacillus sp. 5B6]|nr:hypothetical protein MY7_2114 [Bacillus sp. 5B6]
MKNDITDVHLFYLRVRRASSARRFFILTDVKTWGMNHFSFLS